ncbi:hypothetical protein PISMIDRAFT_682078 [Pisolithus microcarpus 441]|uniref:Uncharacterized protein n=1 Tax=Pisolithus microcarpus 441 TaxID=765257 RepID=A0A0C9Y7K5_9AGAM|nr:hypothetical protein BKA83DRAFT_682078 [Pisolithus microcarpus]KIK20680.1 hypothetical protein PISMIDRAFT_682078 [Pisolithus microcarpus 441]
MCNVLTISNRPAQMQFMKTLVLLALAAYARAQCAACPSTVDGERFVESCVPDIGSYTYCSYESDTCVYTSDGYVLILESSTSDCPTYVGSTTDCISC